MSGEHAKESNSILKKHHLLACLFAALGGVTTAVVLAQSVPDPALKITLVNTNQLQLDITNGLSTANYEIYRTTALSDPLYPWTLHMIGNLGQTNFTASMGIDTLGFFKATAGLDWDSDGIPNWQDAQPSSTNAGILTITIDSPVSGSVFN